MKKTRYELSVFKHRVTAYALTWSLLTWIPGPLPRDRGNAGLSRTRIGSLGPASSVRDVTAQPSRDWPFEFWEQLFVMSQPCGPRIGLGF